MGDPETSSWYKLNGLVIETKFSHCLIKACFKTKVYLQFCQIFYMNICSCEQCLKGQKASSGRTSI